MVVKQRLKSAMNSFIKSIAYINVDYNYNGDIITVCYLIGNVRHYLQLDPNGYYRKWSENKKAGAWRSVDVQNNRTTIYLFIPGWTKNGSHIPFARMVGLMHYLYEANEVGNKFEGAVGYEINHMDMSGSLKEFGWINEQLYNLEFCGATENKLHAACMRKLKRLFEKEEIRFAFSANDKETMKEIAEGTKATILNYIQKMKDSKKCIENERGVYYIGNAAVRLRLFYQYKKILQARQMYKLLSATGMED